LDLIYAREHQPSVYFADFSTPLSVLRRPMDAILNQSGHAAFEALHDHASGIKYRQAVSRGSRTPARGETVHDADGHIYRCKRATLHVNNSFIVGNKNCVHGNDNVVIGNDNVVRGDRNKVKGERNNTRGRESKSRSADVTTTTSATADDGHAVVVKKEKRRRTAGALGRKRARK